MALSGSFSDQLLQKSKARGGKRKEKTLEELQREVAELEALQQQYGADEPQQDKPGLFRRVVDVLSRPNYAMAGAFEELGTERGLQTEEGPGGRIFRELFSGIGSIKGDKEAFGEILEQSGVGTGPRLSNIAPFLFSETGEGLKLQREGGLDITGRGVLGFGLDVALDPTTYLTFGGASAGRIVTSKGTRYLSKAGREALQGINAKLLPQKLALSSAEAITRNKGMHALDSLAREELEKVIATDPKKYLDPGGAKLFGQTVIPGEAFRRLGAGTVRAMSAVPGGERAIRGATEYARNAEAGLNYLFHPFNKLHGLPREWRDVGIAIHRDAEATGNSVRSELTKEWAEIEAAARPLVKKDPNLLKKFYDIREGTAQHTLSAAEQELYDRFASIYDRTGQAMVQAGVMDPTELRPGYFNHVYRNAQDLPQVAEAAGRPRPQPSMTPKFTREREFQTLQEAVDISTHMNRVSNYPVLEPDYNLVNNLGIYIDQVSNAVANKQWADDAKRIFGREAPDFADAGKVFNLPQPRVLSNSERSSIDSFFDGTKGIRELETAFETGTRVAKTPELLRAQRNLDEHLTNAPIKFVERERLKNLDEVRYFRRRGWDIVEEGDDKFVAYRRREVPGNEYKNWRAKLDKLKSEVESSTKRAERDIPLRDASGGKIRGWDEITRQANALLPKLSEDGKIEFFRELFTRVKSASQFSQVALTFERNFRKYMPTPRETNILEPGFVVKEGGIWGDKPVSIPIQIADDIENFSSVLFKTEDLGKGVKELVQGYDWLNKWFKIGNYTFWPASGFRDFYNNVGLSFFDIGIGALARPFQAAKVLTGKGKVTLGGITYDAKFLKQHFNDLGITDPGGRTFAQIDEDGLKKYKRPSLAEKAVAFRGNLDNWSRAQLAINHMDRGLDARAAADLVKEFQFAYNELSPFERSVMRRFIPFYTFPRKAIELHIKAIGRTPGRVINELKPFRGRDDENGQMTSWEGEAFKFRLNRDGKTIQVLTGIDMPIKTLDTLWKGTFRQTARQQLGMVSPLFKAPVELITNQSLFTGRPLDRASSFAVGRLIEYLDPPQGVKDWMGYKKEPDAAGRPQYTFDGRKFYTLFQSWALSRVMSTSERQFREYLKDDNWAAAITDMLTGLRYKDLNLDEEQRKRLNERTRMLEDSLVERGKFRRFSKPYAPKEDQAQY